MDYQELGGPIVPVVESVGYSPLGQISQINYTNGTISQMTYDLNQAYRLVQKQTVKDAIALQNISYAYDSVGNITDIMDQVDHELAKTAHFVYDDLYRLTHAEITDDFNQTTENFDFEYDILGNLREKSDIGIYQYTYDNPYQASLINGTPYHYDANGNLLKDGVRKMTYDYQDRMVSVLMGSNTTNYYYDHSKTRVAKVDQATHDFKFYPSKYYEVSRNGNSSKYMFLGNQRLGIIEKIGTSTQTYLNFSDHLNSSSVTTDDQGNVTNLIDYLPYGTDRVNVQSQSFDPSYKFTDQENDPESGLMYYNARYYEAAIGKFTQPDELSSSVPYSYLVNPQRLNEYAYVINNPINYVDPDGRIAFLAALYLGAAWLVANTPAIIATASALIGGSYAASELGAATGYIMEGDYASAEQCTENAMLAEAGVAAVAGEALFFSGIGQTKSKQTDTATGQTDPQTSGVANAVSKPNIVVNNSFSNKMVEGQKFEGEYFSMYRGEGFNASAIKESGFLKSTKFFTNQKALASHYQLNWSNSTDPGLIEARLPGNVINELIETNKIRIINLDEINFPHAQELIINDSSAIDIINQYMVK